MTPITQPQIFPATPSQNISSVIASVGLYEHTGDWLFESCLPAKTGVGGGIMSVFPGLFGISAFAPPIDSAGNSVQAQLAIKYVMNKLNLHIFKNDRPSLCDD